MSSQQLPTELLQLNNFEVGLKNPTSCMRNDMPVIFFFSPAPGILYLNLPAKPEPCKESGLMALPGLQPFKGKEKRNDVFFPKSERRKAPMGSFHQKKKQTFPRNPL